MARVIATVVLVALFLAGSTSGAVAANVDDLPPPPKLESRTMGTMLESAQATLGRLEADYPGADDALAANASAAIERARVANASTDTWGALEHLAVATGLVNLARALEEAEARGDADASVREFADAARSESRRRAGALRSALVGVQEAGTGLRGFEYHVAAGEALVEASRMREQGRVALAAWQQDRSAASRAVAVGLAAGSLVYVDFAEIMIRSGAAVDADDASTAFVANHTLTEVVDRGIERLRGLDGNVALPFEDAYVEQRRAAGETLMTAAAIVAWYRAQGEARARATSSSPGAPAVPLADTGRSALAADSTMDRLAALGLHAVPSRDHLAAAQVLAQRGDVDGGEWAAGLGHVSAARAAATISLELAGENGLDEPVLVLPGTVEEPRGRGVFGGAGGSAGTIVVGTLVLVALVGAALVVAWARRR